MLALSQLAAAVPASTVSRRADDVCSMEFNTGDQETDKKTWNDSGAADYLKKFLLENGIEDWSNNFFKSVIAGGTQGLSHDAGKSQGMMLTLSRRFNV